MSLKEIKEARKDKARELCRKNYKAVADLCNYIGRALLNNGEYDEAIQEHNEELSICEQLDDILGKAVAHRALGECYSELGRHEDALKEHASYLELAEEAERENIKGGETEVQRAWATIGRTYLLYAQDETEGNAEILKKAENAFKQALVCCENIKNELNDKEYKQMVSRLYLNLGLVFELCGDIKECAINFQKSIHLNKRYDFKEDLLRCQSSLGALYQRRGELLKASRIFDEALRTAKQIKKQQYICDTLIAKGFIMMNLKDFEGGRGYFKKAFKTKSTVREDREKAVRLLKISSVICDDYRQLLKTDDIKSKITICDKLGDHFVALKCYSLAIEYYKEELELALTLGSPAHELAVIYVSIAQTCVDDGQLSEALIYFEQELECHKGNSVEESKTLIKIADIKEGLKCDSEDVIKIYENALEKCIENDNTSVRLDVLKHYSAYMQLIGLRNSRSLEINNLLKSLNHGSNQMELEEVNEKDGEDIVMCDEDENEDEDETDIYDQYNLEDLSDSSGSDFDSEKEDNPDSNNKSIESSGGPGQARLKRNRSKKATFKNNELGESPLHRACIAGKLKVAERLIEKGHPLNGRDFAGWLPIHEAVNHGHLDIVELLIDRGAHINDKGGEKCEGFTPIHDACRNGHINVVRLLMRKGAKVAVLNSHGKTPLDCFLEWKNSVVLNDDEERQCEQLEKELKEAIDKSGVNLSQQQQQLQYQNQNQGRRKRQRSTSPKSRQSPSMSITQEDSLDSLDSPIKTRNHISRDSRLTDNDLANDFDEPRVARREYQGVMSNLRRQKDPNKDMIATSKIARQRPPQISSLLDENNYVNEDWLEDDIRPSGYSKKRGSIDAYDAFSASERRVNLMHNSEQRSKSNKSKTKIVKVNDGEDGEEVDIVDDVEYVIEENEEEDVRVLNDKPKRSNCSISSRDSRPSSLKSGSELSASSSLTSTCVFRIRVSIEDKTLMVPVSNRMSTCAWLMEEVSKRYFKMCGIKPSVSLETTDGAILSDTDYIADVISEKVNAKVVSWIMDALPDRYREMCKSHNLIPIDDLVGVLQTAHVSGRLKLSNINLPSEHVAILLKSLQRQSKLREIDISNSNILFEDSQDLLCPLFSSLPTLQILNLKCTNASYSTIEVLCKSKLLNLIELDLSYNVIDDYCGDCLVKLLSSLPKLMTIDLRANELTSALFARHDLVQAVQDSKLGTFHLESNQINDETIIEKYKNIIRI